MGDLTTEQSWLAQEPLATDLYSPASDEVQAAARAKIDDPEMLYLSLVRALRRRKGFGILFLQCTPAKGQEIFARLEKDLHKKRIGRLTLTEPIGNLFTLVRDQEDIDKINVLFIEGIDKSLAPYIKSETGRNDYYKLEVLPPVLANVNRLRENFREQFPHLCFVLVVPPFALKYFMHRAIDFFSWHSGIWRFAPEHEHLTQETAKALDGKYAEYAALSDAERNQKIVALQNLIDVPNQSDERRSQLYTEQSSIFIAAQEFDVALRCCQEAINLSADNDDAWYAQGFALDELGRYEDAIAAYDKALDIKPNDHEALNNKGIALGNLGRYEDAIAAYEKALVIKPDKHEALYNKGNALGNLGRYEDAIATYNKALVIKPDYQDAFENKGLA
ncbi:MAG: tetratricopeptide repeat protein, partial [Cyanobacteria bacterium P01_F01_bin.53]